MPSLERTEDEDDNQRLVWDFSAIFFKNAAPLLGCRPTDSRNA